MHRSIEAFVLRYKTCQEVGPRCNPIKPLSPHPIPRQPWLKLCSYIFYLEGEIYLILIDCYSNFPIIRNMVPSSTKDVCVVLDSTFTEYGLPKELVTDQGLCYAATEFTEFCQSRFVKHTMYTAFHYSSYGSTERAIKEDKYFCENVSQRALTLTYHYHSIELLNGFRSE